LWKANRKHSHHHSVERTDPWIRGNHAGTIRTAYQFIVSIAEHSSKDRCNRYFLISKKCRFHLDINASAKMTCRPMLLPPPLLHSCKDAPTIIELPCITMQLAFIVNSKSVRARRTLGAVRRAAGDGHTYLLTTHPGAARELAIDCSVSGFTHVIVLGGDGTLNEVVDGMMSMGRTSDQLPILSIIPCGTGNDFARNFELKHTTIDFLARIKNGQAVHVDVGVVEFLEQESSKSRRHFINIMDIGLGGKIARKVNGYRRSRWSFLAYQRAILGTLPFYKPSIIECQSDEFQYSGPALSIVIANGKWFGNGLGIAPFAEVNNGRLSIVVLGKLGILDYILHLPKIARCRIIRHPEVYYAGSTEIVITSEGGAIELDGEYIGESPCKATIIPRAIRILI
jgi:diacylglycerol kinase (ATP)